MFLIFEIDKDWTLGIDKFKHVYGIRLGILAIHIVFSRFSDVFTVKKNKKNKKNEQTN